MYWGAIAHLCHQRATRHYPTAESMLPPLSRATPAAATWFDRIVSCSYRPGLSEALQMSQDCLKLCKGMALVFPVHARHPWLASLALV